jgi:hypothetical protein
MLFPRLPMYSKYVIILKLATYSQNINVYLKEPSLCEIDKDFSSSKPIEVAKQFSDDSEIIEFGDILSSS